MPKPVLKFQPNFEVSEDMSEHYEAPENVNRAARQAYRGLSHFVVRAMVEKPPTRRHPDGRRGWKRIFRADVPHPDADQVAPLPPDMLALIVTAVAQEDANERGQETHYDTIFFGAPTPENPKGPQSTAEFTCEPYEDDGDSDEEGGEDADEEDDDGSQGVEEDDGEGEGGGPSRPNDVEEDDDDDFEEIPPTRMVGGPDNRHAEDAPRLDPMPADAYDDPFAPGAAPPDAGPRVMGDMTEAGMGMGHYREAMHPSMSLFMHHLGGVFAETRATMREMRQDVREARGETKKAQHRVLELAQMGTAHYEQMHKASQMGWNALHQGMQMQLNALQNSLAWERRIMELQHGQQGAGSGAAVMGFLQGLLPQVLGAVALLKGVNPEELGALLGGPPGGMPPGMAPPGMPPGGAPPPGLAPPGMAPPPAAPTPGAGQPPGAPPPSTGPQSGAPGAIHPAAPQPGPLGGGHPAPPPGFSAPVGTPAGFGGATAGPQPPPAGPHLPSPADSSASGAAPSSQPSATGSAEPAGPTMVPHGAGFKIQMPVTPPNGPLEVGVPPGQFGGGPFGHVQSAPPQVAPPPPQELVDPQAMRERFNRAPLSSMCQVLLFSARKSGRVQAIHGAGGGRVLELMDACAACETDVAATEGLRALDGELGSAGVMSNVLAQLDQEQRQMLSDVRLGIAQHLARQITASGAPVAVSTAGPTAFDTPDPSTIGASEPPAEQSKGSSARKPKPRKKGRGKKRKGSRRR